MNVTVLNAMHHTSVQMNESERKNTDKTRPYTKCILFNEETALACALRTYVRHVLMLLYSSKNRPETVHLYFRIDYVHEQWDLGAWIFISIPHEPSSAARIVQYHEPIMVRIFEEAVTGLCKPGISSCVRLPLTKDHSLQNYANYDIHIRIFS